MNYPSAFVGILLLLFLCISGCTTPSSPSPNATEQFPDPFVNLTLSSSPSAPVVPSPDDTTNTTGIPLILSDTDRKMAHDCGWTEKNSSETTALFLNNCGVQRLLSDGWKIKGLGYDMNFLGSRCRRSTHPDANDTCDWCLDAGPTLVLEYEGIMTTEFLANIPAETVTRFRTDMPEGTGSSSRNGSDTVMFRNGTVLYSFRSPDVCPSQQLTLNELLQTPATPSGCWQRIDPVTDHRAGGVLTINGTTNCRPGDRITVEIISHSSGESSRNYMNGNVEIQQLSNSTQGWSVTIDSSSLSPGQKTVSACGVGICGFQTFNITG